MTSMMGEDLTAISTPSTPSAGHVRLYGKTVSSITGIYAKGDDGVEVGPISISALTGASYVTTASEVGSSAEQVVGTAVIMAGVDGTRPSAGTVRRLLSLD